MKNIIIPLLVLITVIIVGQLFVVKSASAYGGGGGVFYSPFSAPAGGVSIVINDKNEKTNSRTVTLTLNGGSDAKNMAVSNSSNFQGASQETYKTTKTWTLTESEGTKTVYVKFYNSRGSSSSVASDSIVFDKGAVAKITADTNNDDKIDIFDFNTLMVNWGKKVAGNIADFDNDEQVGILDFNLLMIHWS